MRTSTAAATGTSCVTLSCSNACSGTANAAAQTPCTDLGGMLCDGQGHCLQCLVPGDCASTGTACLNTTCTAGACGTSNAALGTPCTNNGGVVCNGSGTCTAAHCMDLVRDADETDVDCGGASCTGCVGQKQCHLPRDCQSGACSSMTCQDPTCTDTVQNGTETDVDCGGLCPKCATTSKCLVNADCTTGACDAVTLICVASQCLDHRRDGAETDLDCGGGTCPACSTGKACSVGPDCTTVACDAVSQTCVASQCVDHRKDGPETDVDCGGGTCPTCALNKVCIVDSDCSSNACDALTFLCVASQCADHRRDGTETDVDCGGGICPTCGLGTLCAIDSDCTSNACDGITLRCVANQCTDHRQDGVESDVDCGGGVCSSCAVGKKCTNSFDCQSGHTCSAGTPHLCQ